MRHHFTYFRPTWAALAASALVAACGGGSAGAPAGTEDTTPPTVAITDNVSGTNATTDIVFTFTFNEAVNGFTTDDITVTGGQKGAFSMASNNQSATLVVTPTANSTGTVQVNVAAGSFMDLADNASTAAASASQAFDTTTPAPAAYISFDENPAIVTGMGAYGGALPEVAAAPSGGSANALKIAKPAGQGNETWGGTFFTVPRVPFTSTQKAITARVYSTVANAVIRLKVEVPGGAFVEVAGTTVAQANTWTTVTWNFSSADLAANYTVLAVTPDVSRALDGAIYYIDDINVVDTPAATTVTFASNFGGANNTSAEGGSFGGYSGSSGDGWNCNGAPENCGSGLNNDAGNDRFYYYYNAPASTSGLYVGTYFMAPGVTALSGSVTGLNVSGKNKFNFTFGQNAEWHNSAAERNFGVLFTMSNVYSVGGGTNNCRVELWQVVTPTSANDTPYSINLSDFIVRQDCGVANLTAASALTSQTVAQIDFKANGGASRFAAVNGQQEGANTTNAANGVYPTTLIVKGPLQFE
jgi:hypothetical protein